MQQVATKSVAEGREYQGEIVSTPEGYSSTEPRPGTQTGGTVNTGIPNYDGYYHSHGANDPGYDNENFSSRDANGNFCCDKKIADGTGKPAYLVTPSQKMRRYDPDPNYPASQGNGVVTELGNAHP